MSVIRHQTAHFKPKPELFGDRPRKIRAPKASYKGGLLRIFRITAIVISDTSKGGYLQNMEDKRRLSSTELSRKTETFLGIRLEDIHPARQWRARKGPLGRPRREAKSPYPYERLPGKWITNCYYRQKVKGKSGRSELRICHPLHPSAPREDRELYGDIEETLLANNSRVGSILHPVTSSDLERWLKE